MCTLAVALGADRRFPLVVAANRDERLGRPSEGWAVHTPPRGAPRVAAPRDVQAGGTWIGLSDRGLFAALTNFHAPHAWYPDPERRSRGELVQRALAAPDLDAARAALSALDAARWNPFHLVVAGAGGQGLLFWHDGEASGLEPLGAGLHVVTENARDGRCPRAELVRSRWPLDTSPARLREVLAIHAAVAAPGLGTCIHQDPVYGTRSAAILRLGHDLAASELHATDGPPCAAPLEDRGALLAALVRGRA